MKKRWMALLLTLVLALGLTGCGGEKQPVEEDAQTGVEDTAGETPDQSEATDDTQETSDEENMTEEDMEDVQQEQEPQLGQQPSDTSEKPQTGSSSAGTNEKPQSQPAEKPSAEQKPQAPTSVDLSAFAADLASSQANWPGMMAVEGETLEAYYPGLTALSPKQCVVQMAMISASAVEIALVEVSDSADAETVKGIFQDRIDYQVGDGENPGGALYPASVELWQNNSRIVSNGNYVMLVVFENADGVVDSFNALFA